MLEEKNQLERTYKIGVTPGFTSALVIFYNKFLQEVANSILGAQKSTASNKINLLVNQVILAHELECS